MVKALMAHSPNFIRSAVVTTRVDLIDCDIPDIYIPEADEGQLLGFPWCANKGLNFGRDMDPWYKVMCRQDKERTAIEMEFQWNGIPTSKDIIDNIIQFRVSNSNLSYHLKFLFKNLLSLSLSATMASLEIPMASGMW